MPEPVSLVEVLDAHHDAQMEGLHTAMPARVLSFDPLTQTVSVEPQVKRVLQAENGETVYEALPNIDGVPVAFQRAGEFVFTFPIAKDDFVWLVFSESPLGEWRTTGQVSEPLDVRRHSLGYPMAYPGVYPDTKPLLPFTAPTVGSVHASKMVVGKANGPERMIVGGGFVQVGDGVAPDFAAMAAKVNANVSALVTAINNLIGTYNSHTHVAPGGGGPTGVPNVTQASTSAQPSVAAAVAKIV